MKPLVFVSHIHSDGYIAAWIKERISDLLLEGIDFFVSSDRASILGGDRWLAKIEEALNRASIVLVLCSKESVVRPWINFEAGGAWMARKRVIPLCYGDLHPSDLPEPLRTLQAYNLNDSRDLHDLIDLMAKEAGLRTPQFDSDQLIRTAPTRQSQGTEKAIATELVDEIQVISIAAQSPQRSEWIKSQIQQAFEHLDEEPLKNVHEKLRPTLSEEEKSAIVGLLVDQSRTSESGSLQFLQFFREFSLVEQFKRDWKGRGEYGNQHGDRLLERVLELSTSQTARIRENTTHVLRAFGGRLGIAISTDYVQKLAEAPILLAEDRNVSVVRWALPALADHASEFPEQYHQKARTIIEKSLQTTEPSVRAAGTWALGQVSALYPGETSKLVQLILTQLHDKNFEVIDNAIIALDWAAYSASASIGEVEEDLYGRLVEIAKTSGGARLDRIGSVLEKIGRTLPEPVRTRYEEKRAERLRFERETRSRDKAEE